MNNFARLSKRFQHWFGLPGRTVPEFFNRRWVDYAGLSYDEARDWGWEKIVHPEDRNRLVEHWRSMLASGEPGETEARLRRFDGEYRCFCSERVLCATSLVRQLNGTEPTSILRIASTP